MADGALLTELQAKTYLEIEHSADDTLIGDLIEQAEAALQGYLGVPITAAEVTEYHDGGTSILFLDRYPLDESTVVITDTQGTNEDATDDETVASTTYRVYPEKGTVMKTTSNGHRSTWPHGRRRFKVVYEGGLDQHPDWDTHVQAELRASIRDLVAEWYINRRPGAAAVREGAGLGHSAFREWLDASVPPRVREVWDRYTSPVGG